MADRHKRMWRMMCECLESAIWILATVAVLKAVQWAAGPAVSIGVGIGVLVLGLWIAAGEDGK